jgi:hypothetical protein
MDNRTETTEQANAPERELVPIATGDEFKPGFFGTFTLGLSVWAREMRRILTGQAKRHEVRQLEARLREETALLGRLEQLASPDNPEYKLAAQQVAMLKAEVARLRREEEATEPSGGK